MELSGGERQRVFIAMALAQKVLILFLDEPTIYLDMYHQLEILELVKKLNKTTGLSVVMVLQDINQALQYSDNVIVMKQGTPIAQGAVETVLTSHLIADVYQVGGAFVTTDSQQIFVPKQL